MHNAVNTSVSVAFVHQLFPGMHVTGCYQFRVTRNSNLFVDEEDVDDLRRALEGQLPDRRFGDEVRLEVADNCPPDLVYFLREQFHLDTRSSTVAASEVRSVGYQSTPAPTIPLLSFLPSA